MAKLIEVENPSDITTEDGVRIKFGTKVFWTTDAECDENGKEHQHTGVWRLPVISNYFEIINLHIDPDGSIMGGFWKIFSTKESVLNFIANQNKNNNETTN